ncbi:hypothetical protein E5206_11980 [Arthrobacter sp. PAMC25564]|uniref:hypothetical protein n=1 Tax=Arthrobacter sp. PAMC25564 TaxID=2565366 RepID=UPI0010A20465|nr:hypothetical protein [Arthrobacter sp. PAMC25564]QCB97548.1 hypothetical protein E5206_11980 [Arthrobacter sp. PAMC25564]
MKKFLLPSAVVALVSAALMAPPAEADSTQTVRFSVSGLYCPEDGVYGISHVSVNGAAGMRAEQNFIWNTKTAATSISSVPPEGALANVTVTYRCNVKVLWWYEAGSGQQAAGTRWVYGSGPQPGYTLFP